MKMFYLIFIVLILSRTAGATDTHSCAYWTNYLGEISTLETILWKVKHAGGKLDDEVIWELKQRIKAVQKMVSDGTYDPDPETGNTP